MRSGDQALNSSHSKHELACLVLRVIEKLAPCTEASLIAYVSGNYTSSESPTRHLILKALLKLKGLGLIQSTDEQIGITDAGKRFLAKPLIGCGAEHCVFCDNSRANIVARI